MNFTIRTKLLVGFSIVFLFLVAATLYTVTKLSQTNKRLEDIVEVSATRLFLSNKMSLALIDLTRAEKNIILTEDSVERLKNVATIDSAMARLDSALTSLELIVSEDGKRLIGQFKNAWGNYAASLPKIVSLAQSGDLDKANAISRTDGYEGREAAIALVERLTDRNALDMQQDQQASQDEYDSAVRVIMVMILGVLLVAGLLALWIISSISRRITGIAEVAQRIASREHSSENFTDGNHDELKPVSMALSDIAQSFKEITENAGMVAAGNYDIDFKPRSARDVLGNALKDMTISLRETTAQNERHNWHTTGQNQLNEHLRGDLSIEDLAANSLSFLTKYLNAHIGAIYVAYGAANELELAGQYGLADGEGLQKRFAMGEGLVGQVAITQEGILLNKVSDHQIKVRSSFLETVPGQLFILPFVFEGQTLGVIELGRLGQFTETEQEFLESVMETLAVMFNSALARKRILDLMEETQRQSEELQSQQEELRQLNEELEEHTQNLRQQQEELQVTNEELEEQTQLLEAKNKEIEGARLALEQKSNQLEQNSRYKSEFLANMSHELRTPLNSLLILSKDLSENKEGNLTQDQIESAEIINKSGIDLLNLINEVLDLSKIEAGKMNLNLEELNLEDWAQQVHKNFRRQAAEKALGFEIQLSDNLPPTLTTDTQRLDQIVKNLLSNAIKFTESGSVRVDIARETDGQMSISITDTGIGIPPEKHAAIFEAFQQAEGGTARRYGGTGLGLSISKKLAELLGGEIMLQSKVGEGSKFKLVLPLAPPVPKVYMRTEEKAARNPKKVFANGADYIGFPSIDDDREKLEECDKVLLIIEDDLNFATVVARQAKQKGFKVIAASSGEDGLVMAHKYKPHAIILDIDLPGMDGNKVLAELKSNPSIRHVPVHIMSGNERTIEPIKEGAVEYLTKPIDKAQLEEAFGRMENFINRKMKNLLIIEDDPNARRVICKLIGNGDVKCMEAGSGLEGLKMIEEGEIDCIVLDLGLPDMSGFDFIHALEQKRNVHTPPIIVYTGRELSRAENDELEKYAESIIIKGVKSEERLLDETALFLHRTVNKLPESQRTMITSLYDKESTFHGVKVLVVDDDMRNVFALSKVLKERGMEVVKAENGIKAIEAVETMHDIRIVLMDIMMPEMDGYEAMRQIRLKPEFKSLPIIALTAKAMKEDRQKCIDAGANDYISKPIDVDRLLSLMRVWLSK